MQGELMLSCYHYMQNRFTSFWWGEKGPSALLVLLLVVFLLAPLMQSDLFHLVSILFFALFLLSGVTTISDSLLPRVGVGLLVVSVCTVACLKHFFPDSRPLKTCSAALTLTYLAILTVVVMRHVFQSGQVNSGKVQGAITAYVLIGLTWASLYHLVELQFPGSLTAVSPFDGKAELIKESELTYFSFVTLTTLGYGDITPVQPTARLLVIVEALIGQLFPATLLARLVTLQSNR